MASKDRFFAHVAGLMQENRKYSLANYTSMICSDSQFLTNIATFSEVHCLSLNGGGKD